MWINGCALYGTYHLGKFGTTWIPIPDTSVCRLRRQYRYCAEQHRWKNLRRVVYYVWSADSDYVLSRSRTLAVDSCPEARVKKNGGRRGVTWITHQLMYVSMGFASETMSVMRTWTGCCSCSRQGALRQITLFFFLAHHGRDCIPYRACTLLQVTRKLVLAKILVLRMVAWYTWLQYNDSRLFCPVIWPWLLFWLSFFVSWCSTYI